MITLRDEMALRTALMLGRADKVWLDVVTVATGRYSPEALNLGWSADECVRIAKAGLASKSAPGAILAAMRGAA